MVDNKAKVKVKVGIDDSIIWDYSKESGNYKGPKLEIEIEIEIDVIQYKLLVVINSIIRIGKVMINHIIDLSGCKGARKQCQKKTSIWKDWRK